jgi:ribosomal protein S18 acetylase RimI-like enzyme
VHYRPYTPEDFNALYALEERCFQPPFRFERRYMRQLVARPRAAVWIVEEDERISGFAIVDWRKNRIGVPSDRSSSLGCSSGIVAYIQTIEVAPESRSLGVGRELLSRIEASARQAGASVIWLHVEAENPSAIRLYEAQGYNCEGRQENYYPQGRAALIYRKRLDSAPHPPIRVK